MEVLIASVIGAFVAATSLAALRAVTASAESLERNLDTAATLRFAAGTIRRDLTNMYRSRDRENVFLVGTIDSDSDVVAAQIVFDAIDRRRLRPGEPQGDLCQIEYFVSRGGEGDGEKVMLMRRCWPNPNADDEPGGIVTVIAENVENFSIQYYDGLQWTVQWPQDVEELPELIDVTISVRPSDRAASLRQSFLVNLARWPAAEQPASQQDSQGQGAQDG